MIKPKHAGSLLALSVDDDNSRTAEQQNSRTAEQHFHIALEPKRYTEVINPSLTQ
ncbi:MAG: hypothetical protein OFPI_44200 [Osedax symbiont Rs2]|nr:MAG: hypothetical protein OFPI_44200 [Osedax symbiont Rs2]